MGTPSRCPNGFHDTRNKALSDMGQLDPTKWVNYFEDFQYFTSADWTITKTGAATEALTDAQGGVLLVTNAAADDDSDFFNKVGESFKFVSGKKTWFKARFKVSDATQSDVVMGLQITDTTPLAVTDGVFFRKDDGDANVDFVVTKDSTATTSTAVTTLADDTYKTLAFYYDGVRNIQVWADDAIVDNEVAITNLPDDEELTVSFGIQNGEAVAKTMSVDYIFVAQER